MAWNEDLTGKALEIAESTADPLRVLAGPGTGKSYAMMRRVARLLEEGTSPERILAVTFTRTAAMDLRRELDALEVNGAVAVRATTLHALCFGLLLDDGVFAVTGRAPRPLLTFERVRVLQFEAAPLLRDLAGAFGSAKEKTRRIKAFEAAWARLQSDVPGWPIDVVDRKCERELQSWMRFHEAMLIGEVVPEALRYLRNNPAADLLTQFDHVLVDEYQDLNRAEQELIALLAKRGALTVVGDPDQSIYSFRYAHPEGITELHESHLSLTRFRGRLTRSKFGAEVAHGIEAEGWAGRAA